MTTTEAYVWSYLDPLSRSPVSGLTLTVIKSLLKGKQLNPHDMVWREGMTEWMMANDVPELIQIIAEEDADLMKQSRTIWQYLDPGTGEIVNPGNLTAPDLIQLLNDNIIDRTTKVWTPGMSSWEEFQFIDVLKIYLDSPGDDRLSTPSSHYKNTIIAGQVAREGLDYKGKNPQNNQGSIKKFTDLHGDVYVWDFNTECWVPDKTTGVTGAAGAGAAGVIGAIGAGAGDLDSTKGIAAALSNKVSANINLLDTATTTATTSTAVDMDMEQIEIKNTEDLQSENKRKREEAGKKKKKKKKKGANTWVYANGLPLDITLEEVKIFFSKCGVIKLDPSTTQPNIKLYKNNDGSLKGDVSVCFLKQESIVLALSILDGAQIKVGWPIKIHEAQFDFKKSETNGKKITSSIDERKKKVTTLAQAQALEWSEEGESRLRKGGLKIVIIKYMFTLEKINIPGHDQELFDELIPELLSFGELEKDPVFFSTHHECPISVKFKDAFAAEKCISTLNGRFFDGNRLEVDYWDAVTNYKKTEEDDDVKKRVDDFGDWLNNEDDASDSEDEPDEAEMVRLRKKAKMK